MVVAPISSTTSSTGPIWSSYLRLVRSRICMHGPAELLLGMKVLLRSAGSPVAYASCTGAVRST